MTQKFIGLVLLLPLAGPALATAAKAPRKVCTQILTGLEKISVYQEHAARTAVVGYAGTSLMHATIAALQEHLARARVTSPEGTPLVISPITPFAVLAMDRVDEYLENPTLAHAYGLFEGGSLGEVDATVLDLSLPLRTAGTQDAGSELSALTNAVRAQLIDAHARAWTGVRTRAAVVDLLEAALAKDFARADTFLHVTSFDNQIGLEATGPGIARLVPKLVAQRAPLRIVRPDGRVARLLGYRKLADDERAVDLIWRDVNPSPSANVPRIVPLDHVASGTVLIHPDVQCHVTTRDLARIPSLKLDPALESVQE